MAAAMSSSLALRPAPFATQQRRAGRGGRRLQRCLAAAEDGDNKGLDFSSNRRSALGFTENDSAGQTNIFAVEPKTYVAGSSADNTSAGGQTTIIVAAVAAIGAAAAVAGGLLANSGPSELASLAPDEDVKSLTAYSEAFTAEVAKAPALAPAPAAPAVVEEASE